ncbi:lysophospholipid acyltransferase family protein [Yoonia litorea]|nr:lysophospholipid acyltransferase family protein [Yoonia litorea]
MARHADGCAPARQMMADHARRFLDRCDVAIEMEGQPLPKGFGCVVSYNEPSFIDVAAFAAVMWPYVDRAAAAEFYGYFPFAKEALANAQIGLVTRGKRAGTDGLLTEMVSHARSGARIAWGGEGRIAGFDGIGHYKIGGSLLAIRAQVPVVPVAFYGGHQVMPFRTIRARPGTVRILFGDPIQTEGLSESDARALADRVKAVMVEMYAGLKARAGQF